MLGKTNGENSGPSILRQRKSSVLHLAVSGTFLMPARVFDSRTRMESFAKLIASHIRASASRWDRIPVSRIRTSEYTEERRRNSQNPLLLFERDYMRCSQIPLLEEINLKEGIP